MIDFFVSLWGSTDP